MKPTTTQCHRSHIHLTAAVLLSTVVTVASHHAPALAQRQRAPQPALTRLENTRQDWTIRYEIHYNNIQNRRGSFGLMIDGGAAWAPLLPRTAISDAHTDQIKGTLTRRPAGTVTEFDVRDGYQSGASYATWRIEPGRVDDLNFVVDLPVSSYETRINEKIANARIWPTANWSPMLNSCLEPQRFIEVRDPVVARLVKQWTNGKPKKAKPYMLAKYLASKVLGHMQVSDNRFTHQIGGQQGVTTATGRVTGFDVKGAGHAAQQGKGTRYDFACLLTAVYRAAGLPARIVIGIDQTEQHTTSLPMAHAWVEFFLPFASPGAESVSGPVVTEKDGEWIPVDIYLQKQFSSRPPPLDRPWNFFGSHQRGQTLAPFSFHWVSPDMDHVINDARINPIGLTTSPGLLATVSNTTANVMGTPKRGGR